MGLIQPVFYISNSIVLFLAPKQNKIKLMREFFSRRLWFKDLIWPTHTVTNWACSTLLLIFNRNCTYWSSVWDVLVRGYVVITCTISLVVSLLLRKLLKQKSEAPFQEMIPRFLSLGVFKILYERWNSLLNVKKYLVVIDTAPLTVLFCNCLLVDL